MIHRPLPSYLPVFLVVLILVASPVAAQNPQTTSQATTPEVRAIPSTTAIKDAAPAATGAAGKVAQVAKDAQPTPNTDTPTPKQVKAHEPLVFAPFDVGRRWSYVYVRERTRTIAGAPPEVEKLRGTLINEVAGTAPEFGPHVVRIQSSLHGKLEGEATPKVETSNAFYQSQGTSYQLVAEEVKDPVAGNSNLTRYLKPLRLLESQVAVGHRWTVGVRQRGQLKTELEGEVLGVQDVQTPKGVFERCLVVRLTGKITGIVEAYGTRMEVPDGQYTATEWYAPGVGRVLSKIEMVQKLVLEDGTIVDYVERTQFALRSVEQSQRTVPASHEPVAH